MKPKDSAALPLSLIADYGKKYPFVWDAAMPNSPTAMVILSLKNSLRQPRPPSGTNPRRFWWAERISPTP